MSNFTTPTSAKAFHPDVVGYAPGEVIPEALIIGATTRAGFVEGDEPVVLVPFVDVDDDAAFVNEGDTITEATPDSRQVPIVTGKVAVLVKISREQWGQGNAANLLSEATRRAIIKKANTALLRQAAPTPPAHQPPAGLLHQSPTAGGEIGDNLDAIADAIAQIEAHAGTATNIIASPAAWATVSKLKTATDSNASLLGAGTDAAERRLLGVNVTVSSACPDDQLLVLDKAAVLSAYGQVLLATSTDVYFADDSIGLRVTFRFGAAIADTNRVVLVSLDNGS